MLRRSLQPGKCGVTVSQSGRLEQENQKTAVFKFLRQLQSREQSDGSAVALDLHFFFVSCGSMPAFQWIAVISHNVRNLSN